ncbi:MAG TPA: DUF4595 domain-containing protein [Candidatus Alistipes intestinipullorum]|nr:DUF4595 domain-containing protein [Candidatus Alistipes intestinipullorum]
MKRFQALLFAVVATAAFVACDSGSGETTGADIELAPGTAKNITLYANQTAATPAEGISFTTTGPWRATVTETRASEVDWITLSADHGDAAGDYTITITLDVNTSGADRKATITIESGTTKITITVEQKATTEEGEIPDDGEDPQPGAPERLISQILYEYESSSYAETETVDFTYDDQNRITRVENVYKENGETSDIRKFLYEYGEGVIHVTTIYSSSDNSFKDESESYTAYLNEAGYVTRAEWNDGTEVTYTYDDENRLILVEEEGESEEYVWENGNLVETRYTYKEEEPYINRYGYYEEYPNKENFDLYYDFFSWDEELGLTGRLGVANRNLLKQVRGQGSQAGKDDIDISYEFDDEGYVTKYSQRYSPTSEPRVYTINYTEAK